MKQYTHLTQNHRYQIHALLEAKTPRTRIVKILGVHKSTISREPSRNQGKYAWFPALAHRLALDRRKGKSFPRISKETWTRVEDLLRDQ